MMMYFVFFVLCFFIFLYFIVHSFSNSADRKQKEKKHHQNFHNSLKGYQKKDVKQVMTNRTTPREE